MRQQYRAAIVGLGNIAWKLGRDRSTPQHEILTHVEAFTRHPSVTLAGGCSPLAAERDEFSSTFGVPVFPSLEEMLDQLRPDLVSICSPSDFHFDHVRHCLENGVPMIWLEKPPANSVQELNDLIDLQKQGQSRIVVNYQRRYTNCYQSLRHIFMQKTLGENRLLQVNYSRGLETNGSHLLDLLFYIVGDHKPWRLDWVSTWEGTASPSFALSFMGGPAVIVSGLDLPYHCIDMTLICDEGRASILHGGMTPLLERKVPHELFPGFHRLRMAGNELLGDCDMGTSILNALRDLIAAHEENRQPESCLDTARNTQLLMAEIRRRQGAHP